MRRGQELDLGSSVGVAADSGLLSEEQLCEFALVAGTDGLVEFSADDEFADSCCSQRRSVSPVITGRQIKREERWRELARRRVLGSGMAVSITSVPH